jgi:hypothetical protein
VKGGKKHSWLFGAIFELCAPQSARVPCIYLVPHIQKGEKKVYREFCFVCNIFLSNIRRTSGWANKKHTGVCADAIRLYQ